MMYLDLFLSDVAFSFAKQSFLMKEKDIIAKSRGGEGTRRPCCNTDKRSTGRENLVLIYDHMKFL